MRVDIRIDRLRALHAGEAQAEPYLWPMFFKVDSGLFSEALGGSGGASSFVSPGGAHGNLPAMQSGQTVSVDVGWSTTLHDGDGTLRSRHSVVGLAAVLFEEDLMPGNSAVKKAYAEWTATMQNRVRAAVKKRIAAAPDLPGPYSFSYRTGRDRHESYEFDPIELEAELTKKMPHVHQGLLIDRDDFIGAIVWCVSAAELVSEPRIEFKKLWTPTTGSEEGSWELYVSASQA